MKVGDVVKVKSVRVEFENDIAKGSLGYKAPKGETFVFLLLGSESADKPLDPKAVLNALGWVPDVDAQ